MKNIKLLLFTSLIIILGSCVKEETNNGPLDENANETGSWFLSKINDVDVQEIECYNESYIRLTSDMITFFILDRNEDGSCTTVVNSSEQLTIIDGFYYIGEEALDISIEGSSLFWRVDNETNLVFEKG